MSTYDRIAVGDAYLFGSHTFTAGEIRRFARDYDPQVLRLKGPPQASGWHVASIMMRMMVGHFDRARAEALLRDGAPLVTGPSPGFDGLRWPHPVHDGDAVTFRAKVAGKRLSRSRPGWALLSLAIAGTNQHALPVLEVTTHAFIASG